MSRLNSFLKGVRVLDLSQYIPGPMASLFLADMGAEVLKIEPPRGDEMRSLGPRDATGEPVFYRALNAGKTVRRMDLKDDAIRAEFLAMVRDYDVLIEGFRPGVLARLGIGYPVLSKVNPGLIVCSVSGFGARGSDTAKAAHDGNYLATSGVLDRNGAGGPIFFDPPLSDVSGSLFAVIAILGALHERQRSRRGCEIDLGLADVVMPLQLMQVADWGANAHVPKAGTTYLNGGAAYYQLYATRDGRHVMLGAVEPKFWRAFCEAADRSDWVGRQTEPLPQARLIADLAAYFKRLSLDEATGRFANADCCFSPVFDLEEALTSEQLRSRGLVRREPASGQLQALFPIYVDGEQPGVRPPLALHSAGARNSIDGSK
jgi:crotonobetainyl-CoA:carnitine CoA-transferase CaiB-like acyl-CoA transferase